jgi:hypothetical protein
VIAKKIVLQRPDWYDPENRHYVLDTNVFDFIFDGFIRLVDIDPHGNWYASTVQLTELNNIPEKNEEYKDRRVNLLSVFKKIAPHMKPPLFCLDVPGAGVDQGIFSSGNSKLNEFAYRILAEDKKAGKRKEYASIDGNILADACIIDLAVRNNLSLVSGDQSVFKVAEEEKINVIHVKRI